MKKVNFTTLIVLMVTSLMLLSACSEEKRIVGKWEVIHSVYQQKYTADSAAQEAQLDAMYNDTTYVNAELGYIYEFRDDLTGTITPPAHSHVSPIEFQYYFEHGDDDEITIVTTTAEEWEIETIKGHSMVLILDVDRHHNVAQGVTLPHTEKRYQRLEMTKKN